MSAFKFYLDTDGLSQPHAVFRAPAPHGFAQGSGALERAMYDGSWSPHGKDVRYLVDLWLKGDFDPEEDEITETRANELLAHWRSTGTFPGQPVAQK